MVIGRISREKTSLNIMMFHDNSNWYYSFCETQAWAKTSFQKAFDRRITSGPKIISQHVGNSSDLRKVIAIDLNKQPVQFYAGGRKKDLSIAAK